MRKGPYDPAVTERKERNAEIFSETLCRRSALARSIYTFDWSYARKYHYTHRKDNNYPLDNLNYSAIYSLDVTFFRKVFE